MTKNADNVLERWLRERLRQRLATGSSAVGSGSAALQTDSTGGVSAHPDSATGALDLLLQSLAAQNGPQDLFLQPATLPAVADFGVLAYAIASASSVPSAVEAALTHVLFANQTARLSLVTASSGTDETVASGAAQLTLRHELLRPLDEAVAAELVDETLSSLVGLLRWRQQFHPHEQLRVVQLSLATHGPSSATPGRVGSANDSLGSDANDYQKHFGLAPAFDARRTELLLETLPAVTQVDPNKAQAEGVTPLLGHHTSQLYAETQRLQGMGGQLIRTLIETFGRVGKADRAATALRTSERTMRRRLSQENTSFQRILDKYRAALAQDYLGETTLSTQQIGELLGFTEATNFRRAFLRWSGRSPHDYRSSLKAQHEQPAAGTA
ncbi:MAG: helix-turn-helix domain-containing protein [Pseudomonadales bacterium]